MRGVCESFKVTDTARTALVEIDMSTARVSITSIQAKELPTRHHGPIQDGLP